jgi:hypothetical protein
VLQLRLTLIEDVKYVDQLNCGVMAAVVAAADDASAGLDN